MLYDVKLRMCHSFGDHAASGRQVLRVTPRTLPGRQRVIACAVDLEPRPSERRDGRDFFGNATVETAYRDARGRIAVSVDARVSRTAAADALDLSPPLPALAEAVRRHRGLGPGSPLHFTGPSPRIRPDEAIAAYARSLLREGANARATVAALNAALFADFAFDPEATDVDTPAAVAFRQRRGVCQDFAHVMITALRAVGVPAAYVSGLLRTRPPEGMARLEGADAMHAWVAAWCGEEAGWIEFDPTNGVAVANDHILVAWGRDYADVAPVSGVLKTTGAQATEQAVDVVEAG